MSSLYKIELLPVSNSDNPMCLLQIRDANANSSLTSSQMLLEKKVELVSSVNYLGLFMTVAKM